MNWKEEAIDKLHKFDAVRHSLVNLTEEIRRLESEAKSLRGATLDKIPVQGGGSRREDVWLNNMVRRMELQQKLQRNQSWMQCTQRALGALSQKERLILLRLYISPEKKAPERLCAELGMERSTLYRHRDRALEKFTLALYGVGDEPDGQLH